MTTFIERLAAASGDGPRLAVKDLIDVAGVPTTAACRAVAEAAVPADRDAAIIVRARAAGARIVGKANLHELAYGGTGINHAFGTPVNPLDPSRIPGGSSSGCAVAVATGEADIAFGTDTAGSVRTPSACCGTVGLKTTYGHLPTDGIRPLAPSLDTVGPMARTVADVARGLALLDPAFDPTASIEVPTEIARLRMDEIDPVVDQAIDDALTKAGFSVTVIDIDRWQAATDAAIVVLLAEAAVVNGPLVREHGNLVGDDVIERVSIGHGIPGAHLRNALEFAAAWRHDLDLVFGRYDVIAMPTLPVLAPPLSEPNPGNGPHSAPVNLAGVPALALPVPSDDPLPASIQLVGPHHSEPLLLAIGQVIEDSLA